MDSAEVLLEGGRVTAGVVRIGETVRRPISGDRTQVHYLLVHLEQKVSKARRAFSELTTKIARS